MKFSTQSSRRDFSHRPSAACSRLVACSVISLRFTASFSLHPDPVKEVLPASREASHTGFHGIRQHTECATVKQLGNVVAITAQVISKALRSRTLEFFSSIKTSGNPLTYRITSGRR